MITSALHHHCLSDCDVGFTGEAALAAALTEKNTTLLVYENTQDSYRPDYDDDCNIWVWDSISSLLLRNNQVCDSSCPRILCVLDLVVCHACCAVE